MKQFALFLILLSLPAAAQADRSSAAPRKAPAKAQPAAQPATALPPGAERVSDGVWRARDPQGKSWIYKRTPFGLVRYEEDAPAQDPAAGASELRVVESRGGEVVFQRRTPFGAKSWTKKQDDLDGEEKRAFDEWRKSPRK
jgi:hypothetical protein